MRQVDMMIDAEEQILVSYLEKIEEDEYQLDRMIEYLEILINEAQQIVD